MHTLNKLTEAIPNENDKIFFITLNNSNLEKSIKYSIEYNNKAFINLFI